MSGVYYFDCPLDGGRQTAHSSLDPSNPCPICRIAELQARIDALTAWMQKAIDDSYCGVVPANHIERGKALLEAEK